MVCISLYETGVILGRARREKLCMLARTFPVSEGHEDDFINLLQENARERLEKFGKEPIHSSILLCLQNLRKLI